MGFSWLVALKAVPWTDLVQAAPGIVKGARKLYTSVRGGNAQSAPVVDENHVGASGIEGRVIQLEQRLAALMAEQQASAEVLRNLADQNARLIDAVSIMRARARLLLAACVASLLGCLALAVWALTR